MKSNNNKSCSNKFLSIVALSKSVVQISRSGRYKICLILAALSFSFKSEAMSFDNRYFPLLFKPQSHDVCRPSWLATQTFFMYADRSFLYMKSAGLPEVDGSQDERSATDTEGYDQAQIARALVASGRVDQNPLRADLQGRKIPWDRQGVLTAQGVAFYFEQSLACNWHIGANGLFIHYNNAHEFLFKDTCITTAENLGERTYLFLANEKMTQLLGLRNSIATDTAFGDIDFYLRFGNIWEYIYKFRKVDVGIRLGGIAPTGSVRDIFNPASLPVGGNGHWGIYVAFDTELELKEDWTFGCYARVNHRFPKTSLQRMPVLTSVEIPSNQLVNSQGNNSDQLVCSYYNPEPSFYGALIGCARVSPGPTFIFAPYGKIECLRDALGVGLGYTLVAHLQDRWLDLRVNDTIKSNLDHVIKNSKWTSQYITILAFYDFGKFKLEPSLSPTLTLAWDMPVDWSGTRNVYLTNSVSLILETKF